MDNFEKQIDDIIVDTFKYLQQVHDEPKDGGIIFPCYTSVQKPENRIRVSEQELRCVFIETMRASHPEWYYSVETPTRKKYRFTDKADIRIDEINGKSARFDLTIYADNKGEKVIAHVEFKAHGGTKECDYEKDFFKLANDSNDEGILRYFVQLFQSYDKGTNDSVSRKLRHCKEKIEDDYDKIKVKMYSLKKFEGKNEISIAL